MLGFIKKLLGSNTVDFKQLLKDGAQIVDVRTETEFVSGHILGSINLPLQDLTQQLGQLDKNKPIITCCASGVRSASAVKLLKNNGFIAYNGGGWQKLQHLVYH